MRDARAYGSHPDLRGAEVCPVLFWTAPVPFRLDAPLAGDPLLAYANHGRWVVECPDCHGAQLGHPDDHRFMCVNCANVGNGGAWRPVKWPRNARRIEALLDRRPELARNWNPGETVDDLLAENVTHGIVA